MHHVIPTTLLILLRSVARKAVRPVTWDQITAGLKPGQQYVVTGAFALKSMMVTSGMDAHAGHGH